MENLNYRGSFADLYVVSKTKQNIEEYADLRPFDVLMMFIPLSLADTALLDGYTQEKVIEDEFEIVEITARNYKELMAEKLLDDWGNVFLQGTNFSFSILAVVYDDTDFAPSLTEKSISWEKLTNAFEYTKHLGFYKTMYSTDYSLETDTTFADRVLCLAALCQSDDEMSQFVSYLKITPCDLLKTKKIADVNKDTAELPTDAKNGDYVEATGEETDFPYTISGVEFTSAGEKKYYVENSSSWESSPQIKDDNKVKILSYSREEEIQHCVSFVGTEQDERANYLWGYLNFAFPNTRLLVGNTIQLDSVSFSAKYNLPANSATGYVAISFASKLLKSAEYSGLKPFGKPNKINTEVNDNPLSFYYSRLLSKGVYCPISTGIGISNDSVIKENIDLSFFPVCAREITKYIDRTIKTNIASWWLNSKENVLCNEITYNNIKDIAQSVVISFVSAGLIHNATFSWLPFDEAKVGNSIVATGSWSADYTTSLGDITITGEINVPLTKEA